MADEVKITAQHLEEIIHALQGTCDTLDGAVQEVTDEEFEEDDLTQAQLEEIDQQIFLCTECGWWCDISEESGVDESELVCTDCADVR